MEHNNGMLDILVYLFENFIYGEPLLHQDRDSIQSQLLDAGFTPVQISKGFAWFEELDKHRHAGGAAPLHTDGPVRIFATAELDRLDADCPGFLMMLEQENILDAARRELVLDRIQALDVDLISLEDLKWIVLMVLFNQPGQEAAWTWLEHHIWQTDGGKVH